MNPSKKKDIDEMCELFAAARRYAYHMNELLAAAEQKVLDRITGYKPRWPDDFFNTEA